MASPKKKKTTKHDRVPIRIVPMHPVKAAAASPQLTYRNGALLTNVEVFTLFWGSGWQKAPASGLISQINDFFTYIVASPLIDQLSEYSVSGKTIGHGKFTGTLTVTSPDPGSSVQDSDIQSMVQRQIDSGAIPKPGPNTLYVVYVESGVTVEQGGSASCKSFCGYHDSFGAQIYYGVLPYPDCSGCTGGQDVFSALTVTTSHELCEAITDPVPGEGWYDDTNGEIGDICAWKTKTVGKYMVQQEWSNKAGQCV
jgi:hypothetical protein